MADIYGIAFNIMGGPALKTLKQMSKEADNVGKSAEDAQRNGAGGHRRQYIQADGA